MSAQATLEELNFEHTLDRIITSKKITTSEQRWLISLCLGGSLSHEEAHLVNQVYEALRNGLLVVVETKNQ